MNESKLKHSAVVRMIIVGGLSLALLIPTFFIESLVFERQSRRQQAVAEVSGSWGGQQTLTGPILTVPYVIAKVGEKGKISYSSHHMHLLPSTLTMRGSVAPEMRYRGMYQVALYNTRYHIEGEFRLADLLALDVPADDIRWNEAFVEYGITDLRGIRDTITLAWDGAPYRSSPGLKCESIVTSGITFTPPVAPGRQTYRFSLDLNLNGNSELSFIPIGEVTTVSLQSTWGSPSYVGSFLPARRSVEKSGSTAEWKVLNLNRNFPQAWKESRYNVRDAAFGVRLFMPVDEYQKTDRSIKYALLFIALTFVAFFLSEIIARTILHPIQYALIGLGLIIFYLLLLSISEQTSFNTAYIISSAAVITLVALYTRWVTHSGRVPAVIAGVLVVLYSFLFVTLQLEDYALLIGGIGMFLILTVVMYLTRKVDWFALGAGARPPSPPQGPAQAGA
jgi:inner membrane protein